MAAPYFTYVNIDLIKSHLPRKTKTTPSTTPSGRKSSSISKYKNIYLEEPVKAKHGSYRYNINGLILNQRYDREKDALRCVVVEANIHPHIYRTFAIFSIRKESLMFPFKIIQDRGDQLLIDHEKVCVCLFLCVYHKVKKGSIRERVLGREHKSQERTAENVVDQNKTKQEYIEGRERKIKKKEKERKDLSMSMT